MTKCGRCRTEEMETKIVDAETLGKSEKALIESCPKCQHWNWKEGYEEGDT